jgi:arylsulfatase
MPKSEKIKERRAEPGLAVTTLKLFLHLLAAVIISILYRHFLKFHSLFYASYPQENISTTLAVVFVFVIYVVLFVVLRRYSQYHMLLLKAAAFLLCLVAGFILFRYRPPDHFSYVDKQRGEGSDITTFIDDRRGNVPVDFNHDVRTAVIVPVNNAMSRTFKIQENRYFYLGLGLPLETARLGPLHFSILGKEAGGEPFKIHSRIINVGRSQWDDIFVDMSPWTGKTLSITIQCTTTVDSALKTATENSYFISSPRLIPRRAPDRSRPNIIIILIDTLRYDAANPTTMPNLHRLASRGVWFSRAYSPSSWTAPSVASIFTGQMPCQHRVLSHHELKLAEEGFTIAEALQRHGYLTGAASANLFISPRYNYNQGFDTFQETTSFHSKCFDSAERLNQRLIPWINSLPDDVPLFLYAHYLDPHAPYMALPPNTWESPVSLASLPLQVTAWIWAAPWTEKLKDQFINCYRGECRYVDLQVKELMNNLEQNGFLENAIVFITSDHGEAFLEHGYYQHGADLHQEQVHVPLIMLDTRAAPVKRTYSEPISNIDIFPTILDALDIQADTDLTGRSLYLSLESPDPTRVLYSEVVHSIEPLFNMPWLKKEDRMLSISANDFRLHLTTVFTGPEKEILLYDLSRDPWEQNNLAQLDKQTAGILLEQLESFFSKLPPVEAMSKRPVLDEETQRRLRALGYIHTGR